MHQPNPIPLQQLIQHHCHGLPQLPPAGEERERKLRHLIPAIRRLVESDCTTESLRHVTDKDWNDIIRSILCPTMLAVVASP